MKHFEITEVWAKDWLAKVLPSTRNLYVERVNRTLGQWEQDFSIVVVPYQVGSITMWHITGINKAEIGVWTMALRQRVAPSSYNGYIAAARSFLDWCYNRDVILDKNGDPLNTNLMSCIKSEKVPDKHDLPNWEQTIPRVLSAEDIANIMKRLSKTKKAARNRAIVALIVYSGLRTTEICELTVGGVLNVEHGTIYCKRKGGKWSTAVVADAFYPYLNAYLREIDSSLERDDYLFPSLEGGPMSRHTLYSILSPVQKELGLKSGGHALRAAFASEVTRIGGPGIARDALNHKHIQVTDRYIESSIDQRKAVVNKLTYVTNMDDDNDDIVDLLK